MQWTLLGWCVWLLASWGLIMGPLSPPMVAERWMVYASIFGLMAVWPAARLTQSRAVVDDIDDGLRGWLVLLDVLIEWLALIIVLQVVLWSLAFRMQWSLQQGLWVMLAIVGWSAITAAIVTAGALSLRSIGRLLAMLACILLLVGTPLMASQLEPSTFTQRLMHLSPWPMITGLVADPRSFVAHHWQIPLMNLMLVAAAVWIALGLAIFRSRHAQPRSARATRSFE